MFIDPDAETLMVARREESGEWTDEGFLTDAQLPLPAFGLAIPRAEIFARD